MIEITQSQTNTAQGLPQQQLQSNQDTLPYKNRLQEFAQRAKIPLPLYQTSNEGQSHAPKFKSTVVVDGITYKSVNTFSSRRAAEQDAAKVALEGISRKINNWVSNKMNEEGFPPIYEERVICKSILHEFAAKMNLERPKYTTVRYEGLLPGFVSSVNFGGLTYTGEASKSKKEAEQCAAREVILSILGSLGLATILPEIIKAKAKCFSIEYKQSRSDVGLVAPPVALDSGNSLGVSAAGDANIKDVNLVGNAAQEAPQGSDIWLPGASGDQDSIKAALEAHKGNASGMHAHTPPATAEEAFGVKHADRPVSIIVNPASEAPEGQAPRLESLQVQPNLDMLKCDKKRKSKRKKKSNKKLKTEVAPDGNSVQAVSEGAT